ncbi:MAG: hypothetical protein ACR2PX_01090 [Endozoicomonas sp.]|uniref:hypothetical protein n=1 Tax=Endozoicomonas sp. TaxID=1892382 RepID=UPI003D9BECFE
MRESKSTKIIGIRPTDNILSRQIERLATLERRTFSQMGRILLEDRVTEMEKELGLPPIEEAEEGGNETGHAA